MSDVGPFPIRPGVLHLDLPAPVRARSSGAAALRSDAATDVESDNRRAASLPVADACAIMAASVVRSLEGGRAAILRPERRRSLVAAAGALGVRPFDAHLLIAAVQDRVRRGEDPQGVAISAILGAPSRTAAGGAARSASRTWAIFAAGLTLGAAMGAVVIAWILRAG